MDSKRRAKTRFCIHMIYFRPFLDLGIPDAIIFLSLLIAIIGFVFFVIIRKSNRCFLFLLLIEYTLLVICSTVIFRPLQEYTGIDAYPFWSYVTIIEGDYSLLIEKFLNIIMFLPIGLLIAAVWKNWKYLIIAVLLSSFIEIMQMLLKRGVCEFDDVFHNSLGALIGFIFLNVADFFISNKE